MSEYLEDELETEVPEDGDDEEAVVVDYDILSYPSDFTLEVIQRMWDDGDIVIPDFQREFVWKVSQSSLLVDSFLRGLPVPPVFFYVDEENKSVVIDGQQRILSVVFFLGGHFGTASAQGKRKVFKLQGLSEESPFHNKTFEGLSESDQRKLCNAVLRAINIKQLSPTDDNTSAYHIFERLNKGGTPLQPQEIRNCVYRRGFNSVLKDLNQDPNWRLIVGKKAVDKHQKDVEFILRIFSLVGAQDGYKQPMKEFLNLAMKKHNSGDSKKAKKFAEVFPTVTKMIVETLGKKPFHLRGPINTAALDSVMSVLVEFHNKVDSKTLARRYDQLKSKAAFKSLTTLSSADTKTVRERISLVQECLVK